MYKIAKTEKIGFSKEKWGFSVLTIISHFLINITKKSSFHLYSL